ncbi:MAG: hypothetical protein LPK11_01335 [Chromatiaceae bacterium]|mgnify:CR=1 FL=1|nr:hypothetical protein [Chromatiaceae bacterium]
MRPLLHVRQRLGKHTELVNRRTLITLTVVTSVLLWLLKPNLTLLLNVLQQSEDPSVATAFIRVLQQEQGSSALDRLLAEQLHRGGEPEAALAQLTPLQKFDNTADWLAAHQLYSQILLSLSAHQAPARQQLQHYLSHLPAGLPADYRSQLVDYALQINQPALALSISQTLPQRNDASLLALSLQAGEATKAAHYAAQLYQRSPTQAHLQQLLALLETIDRGAQALMLGKQHLSQHSCNASCLQYMVGLALRNNAADSALTFAMDKVALTDNNTDLLQAANLAEAKGNLPLATRYLEQLSQREPSRQRYQKLHQYYRWQQQTEKALAISRKLVSEQPDESTITLALEDALAESDLSAKADFYTALAKLKPLSDAEIWALVDASDKAYGATATLTTLDTLTRRHPNSARLLAQMARFYLFSGQPEQAIALWPRYQQTADLRFVEVQWFARAFSDLGQPEQALQALHDSADEGSLSTAQLEELLDLASYTANVPLQRYYQQQLVLKPDNVLDPYLAIATHSALSEQDRAFLWQLYQQNRAIAILATLINHAIDTDNGELLAKTHAALQQHDSSQTEVIQLQVAIALYQQDYALAEQLVRQQLRQPQVTDTIWQSAAWLALIRNDIDWLRSIYPRLLQQSRNQADTLRLLAAVAQAIGHVQQADFWHQQLAAQDDYNVQDRLNHALLAEHSGNIALASQLRWTALTHLSQQLQQLPDGRISYQSLLTTLAAPATGSSLTLRDLHQQPDANSVLLLAQNSFARNVAAQQFWYQQLKQHGKQLNASLSLAIALAQRDQNTIAALAYDTENSLTVLERAGALEQIGHMQAAWQMLQSAKSPLLPTLQRSPLQRLAAALHPSRTRALALGYTHFSDWDLNQWQLSYQQPDDNNHWQLTAQHTQANDLGSSNSYQAKQLLARWHSPLSDNVDALTVSALLRQRLSQLSMGQQVQLTLESSPRWQHTIQLQHQMPVNQSKNSYLYAQQDRVSWQPVWQVSRYSQLSATVANNQLNTDFNEAIARQWQLQLQWNEQLSRSPQWQLYAQFDLQRSDLTTQPFTRLAAETGLPWQATDFTTPYYRRLSIGQRLARGEVGKPGAQMPHYRYVLDTALGYNPVTSSLEYGVNAGVGIRVFGDDEVFFNMNWQSADRLGQKSVNLNLGYYIDF